MFSKKPKIVPMSDEPVAAETAAAIISKIRRGSALQLAEKNLTELRRRSSEIQAEMRTLVTAKNKMLVPEHAADIDRDLQRLADEHSTLGSRAAAAFSGVTEAREEYDERVVAALAPLRHEAQATALRAVAELRAAVELFDSCNSASRRVGAPEQRRPRGIIAYLDEITRAFARR
jgi:hypothetical protein